MLKISIAKLKPASPRLNGSVTGGAHFEELQKVLKKTPKTETEVVVLDFLGIESASASYLKRVLAPFYLQPSAPDALESAYSPVAINVRSTDLLVDLDAFLISRGQVLVVGNLAQGKVVFEKLVGQLDDAAAETFKELRELKQTTASQLYERHGSRTTNQTAWNNRLAQLVELRIARRSREGRSWIYKPTITN